MPAPTQTVAGPAPSAPAARNIPRVWLRPETLQVLVALFLLVTLLVALTGYLCQPLGNYDTWFHLRLGHEFWGDWSLRDPRSASTFATSPWVPTQWATEMAASKVADLFGLPGVAFLFGALALLFVGALYRACRREGTVLAATISTFLGTVGSAYAISARPQIVSMVLLAVSVAAWLQTARDLRIRWWLVPLTWVWATAHGLWSFGVVLGLVCAVGVLFDQGPRLSWGARGRILSLPLLCGLAAAVTPVGPRLLLSQLTVAGRTSLISEWAPTSFHRWPAMVVGAMIAGAVLIWARRGGASWIRVLLLLLAAAATAYYTRLVPVGAIIAAPLLTSALSDLTAACGGEGAIADRSDGKPSRWENWAIGVSLVGCLVGLAIAVPQTAARPSGVPEAFASRLAALPSGTTVYDDDVLGGWLEWRFPALNPAIDGMFDAYPVPYLQRWQRAQELMPGWRPFVDSTGARVAIERVGSPMANALHSDLGWRKVQSDVGWVYLVAPGA